jgi:HK97 family phage major capsid protein
MTNTYVERDRATRIADLAARHGFSDVGAKAIATGKSAAQFEDSLLRHIFARSKGAYFSFPRMLDQLATGKIDGLEGEVLRETARQTGKPFDAQRVQIPWSAFSRDLNVSNAGAGGYLVASETGEAQDVLRPWSVTAQAGVTVLERLQGDLSIPKTSETSQGFWLPNETSTVTPSQPTLASAALTPKIGGAFIRFSRRLAIQADAEQYVRRELLRTVGTLVDRAMLAGTGASGQPLGLIGTPGIQTHSGTSLSHAAVSAMKRKVATVNATDDAIAFIGTPIVREVLETRERAAGSGFIWDEGRVAGRPGYVTTDLPAGTLIAGDWSQAVLALWGSGFTLEVNPYDPSGFKSGVIEARLLVGADIAFTRPDAFCLATSVT